MTPQELAIELLEQLGAPSHYTKQRQWRHIAWAEQTLAYRLRVPCLQATYDVTLEESKDEYDLPSELFYIEYVRLMPVGYKVHKRSIDSIDALGTKSQGLPSFYARYGNKIVLDVYPYSADDVTYSLRIRYIKRIPAVNDNSTSFTLPEEYHELILLGALYRAHYALRDYDAGNVALTQFTNLLRSLTSTMDNEELWTPNKPVNLVLPEVVK